MHRLLPKTLSFSAAILGALVGARGGVAADLRVWTVTETRRVLREDPAENQVDVRLAAARNEWVSFQILVRSDGPVGGVRVEPGDLAGPAGSVLRASDARLFRQHQLHIEEPSHRNDAFRPGWYPDPLIPALHPLTGKPLAGARFSAMPFDLPADQTHGFLVDLYIPADAKPGQYRGTYRLTASEAKPVEIPITLTVWDFTLAPTPTLQTAFGSPVARLKAYYQKRAKAGKEQPPKDWEAVELQVAQMLSDHRINATPNVNLVPVAQPDGTFRIPPESIRALQQFVDRYHVNAIQTPHPRIAVKDPVAEQARLRAWLVAWDEAARELDRPSVVFYTYLLDEPNDKEAYQYVQKWGKAVREAHSALKVLVVEQTSTQDPGWGDLYGAVDIWCPLFCLHDEPTAAQRRALGETIWTYTALCQGKQKSPWWQTDFPLLHYRVPTWIAWRYQMRGLLYWGGMSFWEHVEDPWTDPKTYNLRKQGKGPIFQGEGSLVYPGRAVGYDGIAPSLRLKALRDAIEDFEYLAILDRLGHRAEAEAIVVPLAESFFRWEPKPRAYDDARGKLAALIIGAQRQDQKQSLLRSLPRPYHGVPAGRNQ